MAETMGTTIPTKAVAKFDESTADSIIQKVKGFVDTGNIALPDNFSVENAVRFAFLQLSDTLVDKVPILEHCSKASVATAILKMAIQGLSLAKNQCYLIPYGNKLTFQRSAYGSVALAKRVADVSDIKAVVIFKDDIFSYEILANGRKRIIEHKQTLESIDGVDIRGAYAVITHTDGSTDIDIMTFTQIKTSWSQGKAGTAVHAKFYEEMCKKTILNRASKTYINESNDSDLMGDDEPQEDKPAADIKHEVVTKANLKPISIAKTAVASPLPHREKVKEPEVQDVEIVAPTQAEEAGF